MTKMLTRLVDCPSCGSVITLNEVYRTANVDSRWKTCFFKCDHCGSKERTVVEIDVLKGLVVEFRDYRDKVDAVVNVFSFDLEDIDTVDDLLRNAGSFNVPIETIKKCGCGRCGR